MRKIPANVLRMSGGVAFIVIVLVSAVRAQTFTVVHPFTWATGPSSPTLDSAGDLYGTVGATGNPGPPALYKLTLEDGAWKVTFPFIFSLYAQGRQPRGVIIDSTGSLYGTAELGGAASSHCQDGCGVVYKLIPNADGTFSQTILHTFLLDADVMDGGYPNTGLLLDAQSNVYGTANAGGPAKKGCGGVGCGIVFKLSPGSGGTWSETVLYSFTGGTDGSGPVGNIAFDASGNLYGVTDAGGSSCFTGYTCGVVFKLTPTASGPWTETVVHSFSGGADGGFPNSIIANTSGTLYGTTTVGGDASCSILSGTPGCGVAFELSEQAGGSWTETVLHTFTGPDGADPTGLTLDSAGNLYGPTFEGGSENSACTIHGGCGVIYELSKGSESWTEKVLHTFNGYGDGPMGPLTIDPSDNLYGATLPGSSNQGLVFEITP